LLSLAVACLSLLQQATAQPAAIHKITGKITSISNGGPVEGATVTVKGTHTTVQSGPNGDFAISAAPGQHLIISSVGYVRQEVKVTGETAISISLLQDISSLNDVIVVGYGKM